jgi:hypothetical protein
VLHADGHCQDLPGLQADRLLVPGSPVLAAARERIGDGHVYSSFLWPVGGSHAPGGHVRVTVLAAPEDVPPGLTAVALLSPATDLHGLTPRELEVLGLLVEGAPTTRSPARSSWPRGPWPPTWNTSSQDGGTDENTRGGPRRTEGLYVPCPSRGRGDRVGTGPGRPAATRDRPTDRCSGAMNGPSV